MRRLLPAALAAAVLVLAGCSATERLDTPTPGPGEANVDVDTPQLRSLKARAGVEDCAPGAAAVGEGGLPSLSLACLGGGPAVDISTLKGPLVVNLWQSACAPCIKEMPALQAFHEQYGDQVGVIGIDYADVQPLAALQLVRRTGVTYPLLADPGNELGPKVSFPIRGIPYLIFVAADGTVTPTAGGVDSEAELVERTNQYLGTDL